MTLKDSIQVQTSSVTQRIHTKFSPVFPSDYIELVVLGTESSGKSSIIRQYISSQFTEEYVPTVTEHYYKTIQVDDDSVTLSINECGGKSEYKQLQKQYIADGNAFLIVCSVLDDPTQCEELMDDIVKQINSRVSSQPSGSEGLSNSGQIIGGLDQTPVVIVLNKCDILESQEKYLDILDPEDIEKARSIPKLVERKAQQYKIPFVCCNARETLQVNDIFNVHLLKELLRKQKPVTAKASNSANADIENQLKQLARENKVSELLNLLSKSQPSEECFKKLFFISILHEDANLLKELIAYNKKYQCVKEQLGRVEMLVDEESHFKANLLLFALMEGNRQAYKILKQEGLRLKASKLPKQQNLLLIVLQSLENGNEQQQQQNEDSEESIPFAVDHDNYSHEKDVFLTDLALEILAEQENELAAYVNIPCVIENEVRYPIHYAIEVRSYLIADWLLRHNANVDVRDFAGKTALHRAVESGQLKLAKLLLEHKADAKAVTKVENNSSVAVVSKSMERIICEECPIEWREQMIALLAKYGLSAQLSSPQWKTIELGNNSVSHGKCETLERCLSFFDYFIKLRLQVSVSENSSHLQSVSYHFVTGQCSNEVLILEKSEQVSNNTKTSSQQVSLLFQSKSTQVRCIVNSLGEVNVVKPLPDEIVVFVGESGESSSLVCKSTLITNYMENIPSSGDDLYSKELKVHDQIISLNLLDVNGDEEEYLDERIHNSNAFVLVCCNNQKNTIDILNELVEEIQFVKRTDVSQIPIVLVQISEAVSNSEDNSALTNIAKKLNVPHCWVSASNRDNLKQLFEHTLLNEIMKKQSPLKQYFNSNQ
ncbi:hypothetical protein C9374_005488 [Naegleria lovaniensis]|uniref:Ras family small GTPase n=1 Tax=Naegleria lovaniensis TaxID=51637 RepID=A0AA88GN73_NAELO|nr:uncharacterized protein C9374_005488 [Naegleria lovaniensis]KAG2382286.1 hypothetical protein C9374_005488 [Naegleria lovaniensis]